MKACLNGGEEWTTPLTTARPEKYGRSKSDDQLKQNDRMSCTRRPAAILLVERSQTSVMRMHSTKHIRTLRMRVLLLLYQWYGSTHMKLPPSYLYSCACHTLITRCSAMVKATHKVNDNILPQVKQPSGIPGIHHKCTSSTKCDLKCYCRT